MLLRVLLCLTLLPFYGFAQTYVTNGSATQDNCNCYTLTTEIQNQSGAVWNNNKLDLSQPFDFQFNVFLGCKDDGADGIAFILQTQATSIGRNGSGLGFAGVAPSIGIALDTYQNVFAGSPIDDLNDPFYDHISIQANGMVKHGNDLAEPVQASATALNIEDCNWHLLRIAWNPATKSIAAYFDGSLRVQATVDLKNGIFGGSTEVYWGFSAATGGAINVQKFCTALNPDFSAGTNDGTCIGTPLTFTDKSVSFTNIESYYWELGDGTTSTQAAPPPHLYAAPGLYPVRLAITGLDGCKSDTIQKMITIGSIPDASFTIADICEKATPNLSFNAVNIGSSYQWLLNGEAFSTDAVPVFQTVPANNYTLQRKVISDFGCGEDARAQPFIVKPIPHLQAAMPEDVCIHISNAFTANALPGGAAVKNWNWNFGNAQRSSLQNPLHAYEKPGFYNAKVWAEGNNGCPSDTISQSITAHAATAFAGNDSMVLNSVPFMLNASGNGMASWSPATGLDRADVYTPNAVLTQDQRYELTVTTAEGCIAKDSVFFEVFKGSAIYIPTAFTPNSDGRNDLLKPQYTGIRKLYYFTIYNRWGEKVFHTAQLNQGWDGLQGGKPVGNGSLVWMLRAEDMAGKIYNLKGSFVLIR